MSNDTGIPIMGLTRRDALRTGAILTGGSIAGCTGGGFGESENTVTADIVPDPYFIRTEGAEDPDAKDVGGEMDEHQVAAPEPDPQDLIVERRRGNPIDDGTAPDMADGNRFTWEEFSDIGGTVSISCLDDETRVELSVQGLVPGGVYTMWVVVFDEPGFDFDTRNLFPFGADGTAGQHFSAAGPLGQPEGGDNVFTADDAGDAELSATHPSGELGMTGSVGSCLLDEYEVHILGDYHLDGKTHGNIPGPPGKHIETFAAEFQDGEPR